MDRFIAIDVETANFERSSICAIAAVKVENGVIVDSRYSLINPEPCYYTRACTRVHGLTDDDTWNAPSFGTVWTQWQPWLHGYTLVAHNAPFDSACIAAACKIYRLDQPAQFLCTQPEKTYLAECVPQNRSTCSANFSEYHSTIITTRLPMQKPAQN